MVSVARKPMSHCFNVYFYLAVSRHTKTMDPLNTSGLFKEQFIGMFDINGKPIHEGNSVQFYYKGEYVTCKVIYVPEWGMFCLQWPGGYKNKFPMNPEKFQVLETNN